MDTRKRVSLPGLVIGMAVVLLSLAVSPILGVELKSGENVIIGEDEIVNDDLYMTGDTMTVKGRVVGDVVAAGRMIIIEGVVEGDLTAAGQAVIIQGEVTDDVRIAGMTLKLAEDARVGDDVFVAGFSFESEAGSQVLGKTGLTGFQALLAGEHLQGVEASLVGLRLAGLVRGDFDATVESEAGPAWWTGFMQSPIPLPQVEPGLTVADGARIEGDVTYESVAEATVGSAAAVTGTITRAVPKSEPEEKPTFKSRLGTAIRWLVVLFLLGSTLLWLFPDKIVGVADTLVNRPLASLGWGLVTLLGFPVAMLLVLVLTSVLTMVFGMLSLGQGAALVLVLGLLAELALAAKFWIAVFYLAPVVASFGGGRWLLTRNGAAEKSRYLSLLVGLTILMALILIPFLGFLMRLFVIVVGLGAGALWSVRYLARTEAV